MPVPGDVRDRDRLRTDTIDLGVGHGPDPQHIAVHVAWPAEGEDRLPGVVVVHEAFGLNAHIEDVCDRFAAQGFVAAGPDLFARIGGPPDPGDGQAVMERIARLSDRDAMRDIAAVAGWLRAHPLCSGRVGAIGFCMGGRLVLLAATEPGVLDAAVDCWGGRMTRRTATIDERHPEVAVERVDRLSCPLLGVFGEEDQNPNLDDVAELSRALDRQGKENRIVTYPGAGHAFFADYRPSYREPQAGAAWKEFLAWFDRLRGLD